MAYPSSPTRSHGGSFDVLLAYEFHLSETDMEPAQINTHVLHWGDCKFAKHSRGFDGPSRVVATPRHVTKSAGFGHRAHFDRTFG
jgi:hypothetical protein